MSRFKGKGRENNLGYPTDPDSIESRAAKICFSTLTSVLAGILILVLISSCQSGGLRVESEPQGAEVFVSVNGQTSKKLGVTPLNITESQIGSHGDILQIAISKDGYYRESVLTPASVFSKAITVQLILKEIGSTAAKQTLTDEVLQKLASQVALTQSLIKNKDYEAAERTLGTLITQFPSVATLHELMGNINYLKKDLARAHSYYRKAYDLNPVNPDTQRLIQKIESIRPELRQPASKTSGGGQP